MLRLRDPIHGFLHADALEAALIGVRAVQRLRWIHQLGFTFLVYPGAEHSRFSHVLGAMGLAGRVFDALFVKRPDLLPAAERARADPARGRKRARHTPWPAGQLDRCRPY